MKRLVFLALCSQCFAEPVKLESIDLAGKTYHNATLTLVDGGMVRVFHDSGVARVPVKDLPGKIRDSLVPKPEKEPVIEAKPEKDEAKENPVTALERYRIVERKAIPNGGEWFVIVITPSLVNLDGIAKIMEEMRTATSKHRNTTVRAFDDMRAVRMRDQIDLTEEEQQIVDRGSVAIYTKRANSGSRETLIWPEGWSGPEFHIKH
jgi:hypothetical protein